MAKIKIPKYYKIDNFLKLLRLRELKTSESNPSTSMKSRMMI